ncbi:MAG: ABC transporter permease subunit, partial [Candidatus Gallimonas sp.]
YFLVFYAQLRAFPKDYSEAAYIDGAGNFTVMMRIIFPLVRGTFFTVTLLLFINSWNDYTTPMLYMPNVPTLSYGLYYYTFVLKNSSTQSFPMRMAGCIVMMLPILAVFLVFHKRLIGNVSMGGIKE